MRPLLLKMSAFGPYAGEQELDFSQLKGRSFFLIHGATGAGKTTILDAMCFALYGDTSGGLRDSRSMRSDHASVDTLTQVDFTFTVGTEAYQVHRIPEQLRPKKRGEGLTQVAGEASLWRIVPEGERQLLAGKWNEVTQQVEQLLGFKSSQFRQVVLLPQGEFRRLLTANSAERQEIMQTLFKTEQYRVIEEYLKEKSQEYKKQHEDLSRQRQWVLQEAGASSPEELAERWNCHAQSVQENRGRLATARQEIEALQGMIAEAVSVEAKLLEQQGAQQAFSELTAQLPAVEKSREHLAKALKASSLEEAEKHLLQLDQERKALEEKLSLLDNKLKEAQKQQTAAEQRLKQETDKEAEGIQITQELVLLEQVAAHAAALKMSLEERAKKQSQLLKLAEAKEQTEAQLAKAKAKREETEQAEGQLRLLALQEAAYQAEESRLRLLAGKSRNVEEMLQELARLKIKMAETKNRLDKKEGVCQERKAAFLSLQEQWFQGQAALLAASLKEGEACPVCGSAHHPKPAAFHENLPSEAKLKAFQAELEALEKDKEETKAFHQSLMVRVGVLEGRVEEVKEELKASSPMTLSQLEQAVREAQAAYEQAAAAGRKSKVLTEEKEALLRREEELRKELEERQQLWQEGDRLFKQAEAIAAERQGMVPEAYRNPGSVEGAQKKLREREQALKEALQLAQQGLQKAQQTALQYQVERTAICSQLDSVRLRCSEGMEAFEQRLKDKGFTSRQQYEQEKKPAEYVKKLEEQIKAFEQQLAAAQDRLQRAESQAKDLVKPDLDSLREKAGVCQDVYNRQLAECTRLEEQLARERNWLDKTAALGKELGYLEGRYGTIGRLAEVANGGNEYKLTFQRFVLGALLEDVALAANQRLRTMSRGRYELQRTMDRARKNAAGGLDLEVFDHYTGVARGVSTLSGGETFLASLSLALGLADVVQSYAGGIHLETILVDEGFGTLDPEALDFAIKALVDLQKGGRLVGIISHVPELRERLDARLEVTRSERGSQAEFKVG